VPPRNPNMSDLLDTGNQLLAVSPAELQTSTMNLPQGQFMVLTIRTPTTTLTVMLAKGDAEAWAKVITTEATGMSGLAVGTVTFPKGSGPNGKGPHRG
jgi:hypothetical protein